MKPLRFAPIIRVSTESQKKKKESLLTQKKQILEYVNILKGTIPKNCWIYSGQEHATPEYERQKLNLLLEDSGKDLFDAVITVDATRWSRDNHKSKKGLKILRSNNIRFFVGIMEYNLLNPEQIFFLSMAVEIGEFQANLGALKSITTRINKARRGEPATRLPIGRTWSKEDGWGVDKEISQKFTTIAKRFLAGEDLTKLGQIYGMSRNYLREILTKRCGDIWQQKFYAKRFNINEVIPIKIPPLIDDPKTIEAIKERVQLNKTIFRGPLQKSEKGRTYQNYLFSKMILCGHCKTALFGEMMNKRTRHYRHRRATEYKGQITKVGCIHFKYVPADLIEEPIMKHIFEMFGDPVKAEQAIKDTIPDLSEVKGLEEDLARLEKDQDGLESKIEKWMDKVEDEDSQSGSDKFIMKRVNKYIVRHGALEEEIRRIKSKLNSIPDKKAIQSRASIMKGMIKRYLKHPGKKYYEKMTFEEKRQLLQHVFIGKDADGNRLGIYIKKYEKGWKYEIRGILMSDYGSLSDDALLLDTKKTTIGDRP